MHWLVKQGEPCERSFSFGPLLLFARCAASQLAHGLREQGCVQCWEALCLDVKTEIQEDYVEAY